MSQSTMAAGPVSAQPTGNYQASRRELGQRAHVSLWNSIRSEYVKLMSLKSTWILLIINFLLLPGGAALSALSMKLIYTIDPRTDKALAQTRNMPSALVWQSVTAFVTISTIVVGILGVMSITTEFTSDSIDSSLTANPHRGMMVGAKAIVVAALTWASTQLAIFVSWGVVRMVIGSIPVDPLQHGEGALLWVSLFGPALVSACFAVLSVGLGALCRSTVGAVFALIGIDMFLPEIVILLSNIGHYFTWTRTLGRLMPSQLVDTFITAGVNLNDALGMPSGESVATQGFDPSWWQAGLIFLVWVAAFYIIGAIMMDRRDIK
ncbi:ABC transporter permease [Bombiscardovia nodaiensis]|uniref:ABC transporter permease n=1 Tax=Bombiscardovia nodaiensis TaxID=2932181 RepID=A0ABM8B9Z6_9BIFI|nr:ABC transporter permease [Bombiscardovia nodaiensis]